MYILGLILCTIAFFLAAFFIIGIALSTQPYKGPKSDHFDGKRFKNFGRSAKGFKEVGRYARERNADKWIENYETFVRSEPIPEARPEQIQFTFVNHSTFLIQHKGVNILTDPIWSKRCSPFQFMGPKRMRPPGIRFEDLPEIHLVLVSHNHYDHLDRDTIMQLNKQFNPQYVVPLGMKQIMKKFGCEKIVVLDWWDSFQFKDLLLKATPSNHFSSRGINDRNTSLWCGYLIQSDLKKIYFTGDTGYSDIFKEIGEREGPMDLSFIPIGAFRPEWFMSPIHCDPIEAVEIHKDVKSKWSVAMHFGTFPLADDNPERAISMLELAKEKAGLDENDFSIPEEGEVYLS